MGTPFLTRPCHHHCSQHTVNLTTSTHRYCACPICREGASFRGLMEASVELERSTYQCLSDKTSPRMRQLGDGVQVVPVGKTPRCKQGKKTQSRVSLLPTAPSGSHPVSPFNLRRKTTDHETRWRGSIRRTENSNGSKCKIYRSKRRLKLQNGLFLSLCAIKRAHRPRTPTLLLNATKETLSGLIPGPP